MAMVKAQCKACGKERIVNDEEGLCLECLARLVPSEPQSKEEPKRGRQPRQAKRICSKCGSTTKELRNGLCKKCYDRQWRESVRVIHVYFHEEYHDLYERVVQEAKYEFRSPSQQIIYILRDYYRRKESANAKEAS